MSHEYNCQCPRCEREREWLDGTDAPDDRYAEMVGAGEWEDRVVPNLADFEAKP